MPKTDPEIITLGAVGTVTVTAPSALNSATVQSIEGGTVTRAGAPLAGGETLHAGETLTFTPATAGGTTYLNVRVDNAEFSGHYDDLDGKPDGTGATGPAGRGIATITVSNGHLTGTYSDGTAWDAGALPAGSGGTLDAEAVQDIVGAMLGEVQGHYDDAAGTYIINLPTGGTVTDEQVQDIVGAFIKAGTNVTVNYDDAANTLTVSAVGGGGGGGYSVTNPVPLKFLSGNITTQAAFTEGIGDTNLVASYQGGPTIMRFQAATAVAFDTIKLRGILSDGGTGTLTIRQSDNAWGWGAILAELLPIGNGSTSEQDVVRPLGKTLNFAAGERFLVIVNAGPGAAYITGTTQYAAPKVDALGTITSYGAENSAKVPINLLFTSQADVQKGVLGPLDPVDFPVSTTAAAPNNSGFMVVDNAAKTASLYWKFSDGSTKKIDLT